MDGRRTLHSLCIKNLLSFGNRLQEIELEPLNVLIGPNGVGKSNLIEVFRLLQAAPGDLTYPIRAGGGIREWLWKGLAAVPVAEIDLTFDYPESHRPLRYRLAITAAGPRLELLDEAVEEEQPLTGGPEVYFYYRYQQGRPALNVRTRSTTDSSADGRAKRELRREHLAPDQSVLSQLKDPEQLPELTYLANLFAGISIQGDWDTSGNSSLRSGQRADAPADFLLPDASNLFLILNDLETRGDLKRALLGRLRDFYEPVTDLTVRTQYNTVMLFVHERDLYAPTPATRLSDGTLRYLCLLAILLHPDPPPLVCLEEPELGLHPDIIPKVAELLVEASQHTQLVVTTHSEALVSALSETPEAVVVCERDEQGSVLRRLDPGQLAVWLERYSLGELWSKGEIGGNRW